MSGIQFQYAASAVCVEVWKEDGCSQRTARNWMLRVVGHTPIDAKKNLGEVIGIQLEETAMLGTLKDFLAEAGYVVEDEVLETEKKIVGSEEMSISVEVM